MLKRFRWFLGRGLLRNKRGFTLIEVVIAIAVLGIVVASVPAAVMAIHNAQFKQNELRISERMARAQFEYIKSQEYIPGNTTAPGLPKYLEIPSPEVGSYFIKVTAYPIDPETYERLITNPEDDQGLQEIEVIVFGIHGESAAPLYETSDYKVHR